MSIFTILGFIATLVAVFASFWIGLLSLLLAIRDEDYGALVIWLVATLIFIGTAALAVWQPLHWAGLA